MPRIYIQNKSSRSFEVFVSKYNGGGSDDWFTLNPEQGDGWNRDSNGWELVAFKIGGSRAGVYVPLGSTVQFYDLTNIQVIG